MKYSIRRVVTSILIAVLLVIAFPVAQVNLPVLSGGNAAVAEHVVYAAATANHVKRVWANKQLKGAVTITWTKKAGFTPKGWQVKYRTRSIKSNKWSAWKTKSLKKSTYSYKKRVKANYLIEFRVRAKGDKSWSKKVITTPLGGKYRPMSRVFVKNAKTKKRVSSLTLKVGQTVSLKPDYQYPAKKYSKQYKLYPTRAYWDLTKAGKKVLTIKKPGGKTYTGGMVKGTVKIKAVKAGKTTLVCRAPNGQIKTVNITVKPITKAPVKPTVTEPQEPERHDRKEYNPKKGTYILSGYDEDGDEGEEKLNGKPLKRGGEGMGSTNASFFDTIANGSTLVFDETGIQYSFFNFALTDGVDYYSLKKVTSSDDNIIYNRTRFHMVLWRQGTCVLTFYFKNGRTGETKTYRMKAINNYVNEDLNAYDAFRAEWIKENITDDMTITEKVEAVGKEVGFFAPYCYEGDCGNSALTLYLYKKGTCWGFTEMAYDFCTDLGIRCEMGRPADNQMHRDLIFWDEKGEPHVVYCTAGYAMYDSVDGYSYWSEEKNEWVEL